MNHPAKQLGFTLIEVMSVVTVLGILALQAIPSLSSYVANSKLRDGANTLAAAAAAARSEAIKRNGSVSLTVAGTTLTIARESDSKVLRTLALPAGVATSVLTTAGAAVANSKVVFNSEGMLTPFGAAITVTTELSGRTCSDDLRCPSVLVEGGGAANVCARGATNGACK